MMIYISLIKILNWCPTRLSAWPNLNSLSVPFYTTYAYMSLQVMWTDFTSASCRFLTLVVSHKAQCLVRFYCFLYHSYSDVT